MKPWEPAVAAGASAIFSMVVLLLQQGVPPTGDSGQHTLAWWFGVVLLDAVVAAGLLFLAGKAGSLISLAHHARIVRDLGMGVFGPLALRSPVRKAKIGDRSEAVGITWAYDAARIKMLRKYLDAVTVHNRNRRFQLVAALQSKGWDSLSLRGRLEGHLDDQQNSAPERDPIERDHIRSQLRAAMTFDTDDERLASLATLMIGNRFTAVASDCRASSPKPGDVVRGRTALESDARALDQAADAAAKTNAAVLAVIDSLTDPQRSLGGA